MASHAIVWPPYRCVWENADEIPIFPVNTDCIPVHIGEKFNRFHTGASSSFPLEE